MATHAPKGSSLDFSPMGPEEERAWNDLDQRLNGANALITRVADDHPRRDTTAIIARGKPEGAKPAPGKA